MTALPVALILALAASDAREEARLLFEEGLLSLDAHDPAGAVRSFQRSLALRESGPVLYNLGLAHRQLGERMAAIAAFERFLEKAPSSSNVPHARALVRELRRGLGRIVLDVAGGADAISIDGRAVESSTIDLEPGTYVVRTSKQGHRAEEERVSVTAGSTTAVSLDAARRVIPGRIAVITDQTQAEIVVDHLVVGHRTYEGEVEPGAHWVDVTLDGFLPVRRRVMLDPDGHERIEISLIPVPDEPLTSKWWFWTVVGIGVAAAAGGTAAVIVATRPEPDGGTTGAVFFDD